MRVAFHRLAALLLTSLCAWAQSGSISGRVVDAKTGAGLHRAEVRIAVDERDDIWGSAPTDAEGRFTLRQLPAGKYRISASKLRYQTMAYGSTRPFFSGTVVVLNAGEAKTGVDIALPRFGSITGTVYGADGEPAPHANVQAWSRQYNRGQRAWMVSGWAMSDERGRFRVANLLAGEYLISASGQVSPVVQPTPDNAPPRATNVTTYAPGTPRRSDAQRFRVNLGQTTSDIDVHLLTVLPARLKISARVPFPLPKDEPAVSPRPLRAPAPAVRVFLTNSLDGAAGSVNWSSSFGADRSTEFQNLEPGDYRISASVSYNGRLYAANERQTINGDTEITLDLKPAISLSGTLRVEGAPLTGRRIQLTPGGTWQASTPPEAVVKEDGSFTLENIPPGIWDIGVEPMPKNAYYKSMWLGPRNGERLDVLRKDMPITADSVGPLDIVVSTASAEVTGKVVGGVARTVLALPAGANADVASFAAMTDVDDTGAFRFRALTPGTYALYAFEDLPQWAWLEDAFIKGVAEYGVPIELSESAKESVTLTAIPAKRVAALMQ